MVKNTKGGSKHKKMARKQAGPPVEEKIRYSSCEEEMYASVARIYGNGRILVTCNDGVERLCVIRKKFKGRNKRSNEISLGTYLLVGKREWNSVSENKLETTDLLYVYSQNQANKLKYQDVINTKFLMVNEKYNHNEGAKNQQENNNLHFLDEEEGGEGGEEEEEEICFQESNENKNEPYFEFNYSSSEEEESYVDTE
jgi:initiation factor 1A